MIPPLHQSASSSTTLALMSPTIRRLKGFSKAGLVLQRKENALSGTNNEPSVSATFAVGGGLDDGNNDIIHRSQSPSSSSASQPKTVKQCIIAMLREDGGKNALSLQDCMIRSEYTRQWINKHIKNNVSNAAASDTGDLVVLLAPKTKTKRSSTGSSSSSSTKKKCHSARLSSSKRFFRMSKMLEAASKSFSEKDLRLAAASRRQIMATSLLKPPFKALAHPQTTTAVKDHALESSGVLLRPNCISSRQGMVSDFLRRVKRP